MAVQVSRELTCQCLQLFFLFCFRLFDFIITCSLNLVAEGCVVSLLFVGNEDGWLKNDGAGGGEGAGGCSGGKKLLNVGDSGGSNIKLLNGDGGGDRSSLLFELKLSWSSPSAFNLLWKIPSIPAGSAFLTRSLSRSFLPTPSSFSKDPTIGFCASDAEIS